MGTGLPKSTQNRTLDIYVHRNTNTFTYTSQLNMVTAFGQQSNIIFALIQKYYGSFVHHYTPARVCWTGHKSAWTGRIWGGWAS